jgi:hypothetical protein
MEFKPYPSVGQVVLLAGAEGAYFRKLMISMGVKGCLLSYYYLRTKLRQGQENMSDVLADLEHFDFVFLDSGGYTLQLAVQQNKLNVSLKDYVKEFYAFAHEYRRYFTVFGAVDAHVEGTDFDFDTMVSTYFEAIDNKIHVAPTVTPELSLQKWIHLNVYKSFDYVAYNRAFQSNKFKGEMRQHLMVAHKNKVRTHGYAMTKQEDFRGFNFSSVDSLTWLGGQKYGTTYVFRAGKMRTFGLDYKSRVRRRLVNVCRKYDIDFKAVMNDEYKEVNKLNLIAWMELDEHQRIVGKRRAYWLKQRGMIMSNDGEIISNATSAEDLLAELAAEKDTTQIMQAPEEIPTIGPEPSMETPRVEVIPRKKSAKDSLAPVSAFKETNALDVMDELDEMTPRSSSLPTKASSLSRALPLQCNTCLISDRCPKMEANSACRISFAGIFRQHESVEDALPGSANEVLQLQYERVMRASLFERADGGALDQQLSAEISRYFSMLHSLKSLGEKPKDSLTITAGGNAASALAASGGGGMLQGLLQSMMKK